MTVTFDVDELNQHAIEQAVERLGFAAAPVAEDRRYEIAEAIVAFLQRHQHDHGMGHMHTLAGGTCGSYDARHSIRGELYAMHSVTGPQVDAAIQAAARVLWNEA